MMEKLKLYLDTTVVSFLYEPERPDWTKSTLAFWERVVNGEYDVVVSDVLFEEIEACYAPKRTYLFSILNSVKHISIEMSNEETRRLSLLYIANGFPKSAIKDAMHIAIATIERCDFIVSWNFQHMVDVRHINTINKVNFAENYSNIYILSPEMILTERRLSL